MAAKTHVYQSKIQYDADGTPPFTDLADVKMIAPPNLTKGDVDITHLESTGHFREALPGWRVGEDATFDMYFTKTQFNVVLGFFNSETIYYWRILYPLISGESSNSMTAFQGYVKGIGFNQITTNDEAIMCPVTIHPTTTPTFTAGT